MNDASFAELKVALTILGEFLTSIVSDIKSFEFKDSQGLPPKIIPSLIWKLQRMVDCAKSVQKICKSLRGEGVECLPCLKRQNKSVNKDHSD